MDATWAGVYPAATTQFTSDQALDLEATKSHVKTLIEAGVHGLIMLGTVGENTALEPDEKRDVLKATLEAAQGRVPVLSGVAECSTARACRFAEDAARDLYRWFMPVLHLDCHVKLVQYIKLAQAMAGRGSETVRGPRMTLEGEERRRVAGVVQWALDSRPKLAAE